MTPRRLVGVILVIVGAGIAYTGYEMSQTVSNQLASAFSESPSENVAARYVLGAVSAAVGLFLAK